MIEDFVQKQAENPMPRKIKDGQSIHLSHNDFGTPKSFFILPKIVDFGLAQSGKYWPLMHPIQAAPFHAPEVLLNTSWTYSADIWNLGVLIYFHFYLLSRTLLTQVLQIWNIMEGRDLFTHLSSSQRNYDVGAYLGEMIALLGPPPKELIDREIRWSGVKWSHAVSNSEGRLSQTAREFFGGPFFYPDGEFMYKDLIPTDVRLEDTILSLEGEDKLLFLDFVRRMLQWLPEDRAAAKELIDDPWLEYKST
jgi:serine/threonine protein kinase